MELRMEPLRMALTGRMCAPLPDQFRAAPILDGITCWTPRNLRTERIPCRSRLLTQTDPSTPPPSRLLLRTGVARSRRGWRSIIHRRKAQPSKGGLLFQVGPSIRQRPSAPSRFLLTGRHPGRLVTDPVLTPAIAPTFAPPILVRVVPMWAGLICSIPARLPTENTRLS